MRRMIDFDCAGEMLVGTLDAGEGTTGLLIVSGGNEIRSGTYAGLAMIAGVVATTKTAVFRYDRRGIGDSAGNNAGFESSAEDIAAAVAVFRNAAPYIERIVAFGNCDAASALALFHSEVAIDALVLANPWVMESAAQNEDTPTSPSVAAIRARYVTRLKNPRSLIDLFTGKINIQKLVGGLASASRRQAASGLSVRIANALATTQLPVTILIARRDTTALAFMAAWSDNCFASARAKANIKVEQIDSASHSFADAPAKAWLLDKIRAALTD